MFASSWLISYFHQDYFITFHIVRYDINDCQLYHLTQNYFSFNYKVIIVIGLQSSSNNHKMNTLSLKESIYSIEPWHEQTNLIPSHFLATQKFAKTSFNPIRGAKSTKKLEIATNSVYLIKNHQDFQAATLRSRIRMHCTADNSPKMAEKSNSKTLLKRGLSERAIKSQQISSQMQRKRIEDLETHPKFQETKQTFIEFKMLSKNKHQLDGAKVGSKPNLKKKYEKSAITQDTKKFPGKYEDGFEEISLRRKLKTEKSSQPDHSIKNLLQFSQDPQKEPQQRLPSAKQQSYIEKPHPLRDTQTTKDSQTSDKLKFELMMQRKLFLMKNNLSKWHKNTENIASMSNRIK